MKLAKKGVENATIVKIVIIMLGILVFVTFMMYIRKLQTTLSP